MMNFFVIIVTMLFLHEQHSLRLGEPLGKVPIVLDRVLPIQSFRASQLLVEDGRRADLVSQSLWGPCWCKLCRQPLQGIRWAQNVKKVQPSTELLRIFLYPKFREGSFFYSVAKQFNNIIKSNKKEFCSWGLCHTEVSRRCLALLLPAFKWDRLWKT